MADLFHSAAFSVTGRRRSCHLRWGGKAVFNFQAGVEALEYLSGLVNKEKCAKWSEVGAGYKIDNFVAGHVSISDQMQYAKARPGIPVYQKVSDTFSKAADLVFVKKKSAKQALDDAASKATKYLQ